MPCHAVAFSEGGSDARRLHKCHEFLIENLKKVAFLIGFPFVHRHDLQIVTGEFKDQRLVQFAR